MMKFFLAVVGVFPVICIWKGYMWFLSNVLILVGVVIMFVSGGLTDCYFFSPFGFMDILSFSLVLLSLWITILMYYSSFSVYVSNNFSKYFVISVLFLCLILMLTFSCSNLLMFYFFFEASLIPTLFIILGWGYQPERLQAGIYFLFYTLTASLPLLLMLVLVFLKLGSLDGMVLYLNKSFSHSFFVFLIFTLAFLVKMPMFFTHLWLPKAHVEAPVSGSMILAGILLKLGGYGFYRVLGLCVGGLKNYGGYFFGLSILGMLYVGLICCRLNDLKALVAYSSVAHMALVICGVFSIYFWGYTGGLMMMVAHGLASSGLFCIVNMFYERTGSRSIFMNKGFMLISPLFSLMIFLLSAANMAAPPTVNLLSEIFLMVSILKFDSIMLLFFPLGSYMGAVFTVFLFSFSQHGKTYTANYSFLSGNFREFHTIYLHILPVNFLILKPEYFLSLS